MGRSSHLDWRVWKHRCAIVFIESACQLALAGLTALWQATKEIVCTSDFCSVLVRAYEMHVIS